MKKIITMITVVAVILFSCISASAVTVYRYGDWTLTVISGADGYAFGVRSYEGEETAVTVPDNYGGYPIVALNAYAFSANTTLREIVLSDQIVSIGNGAFLLATNLEKITMTSPVCSISDSAFRDSPNVVIYAPAGSYAVTYAKEHRIEYMCTDEPEPVLGDVNDDGDINIGDVTELQRHLAELIKLNRSALLKADANQDGEVNISDATALQMFLAEYEVPYPIGESVDLT